jgi:hypothetical protein
MSVALVAATNISVLQKPHFLALAGLAFSAQQCHSNIIIVELTVFKVNTNATNTMSI